ncbi:hypothetical protein M2M59_14855 [Rummeliibacillus sp. G93]|uniref:hypothetical protein n=1 Tax=Rummeliibacillus TaxID=648802 RepID=UPI00116A6234|nr:MULTISPECIES: hypothetical protein [Rummeliibacillus]MBB5171429.1 membrane-bound ClpP family serine protease [Rummeliibacillus stabekisii]MCM3317838.1 hypothetical protein [Rummeliibacillus stabekisii]UQW97177.1 hypothetical protein M2M59_14855 [Rummeliibacillus sp. G93]GEL05736.1 hypothetical protein RST01_23630 [Rummeliibacillus stabekisii]
MRYLLFYAGLLLLIIGLAHPLGIVEANLFKYMLYTGIIAFGIGVLLLPGEMENRE